MKTRINKKKIFHTCILFILVCFCFAVCFYYIIKVISDTCIFPKDEISNINEEQVERQINELFMTFTDEELMTIKKIFDDVYTQRKTVDHWPQPSDESKKYITQFDDYAKFLFPKALIIGNTGDDYTGFTVVREKEEVGMLCEFGVFRPEPCYEAAHYGICYFYDPQQIDSYLDKIYTPYYYEHPLCINYLSELNENMYVYIYYTSDRIFLQ